MLSQYRTWTWSRYRITNNRYQSANMTASLSCQRDADMSVTDAAARVRRGVASGVTLSQCRTWTRSRYQITNNCYQSANVTLGLSCQRDADRNVTDTAARVRGEWRHAVGMSNMDPEPLSDCEQPLSIRERDGGPVVPA